MNKTLPIPLKLQRLQYPGQVVFHLFIFREALRDWCLGLSLLEEGLIDALVVTDESKKKQFNLRIAAKSEVAGLVGISFRSGAPHFEFTRNNITYLRHFFLRYYRDGVAEVDHIDFEGIEEATGSKAFYITFQVPDYMPPVSPEEAERRLRRK